MFHRSVLPAAMSLAVVLLTATGCKIQVPDAAQAGASSTSGAVASGTSGVTRAGSLIVEPGAGFSPVYDLIDRRQAQHRRDHVRVLRHDGRA